MLNCWCCCCDCCLLSAVCCLFVLVVVVVVVVVCCCFWLLLLFEREETTTNNTNNNNNNSNGHRHPTSPDLAWAWLGVAGRESFERTSRFSPTTAWLPSSHSARPPLRVASYYVVQRVDSTARPLETSPPEFFNLRFK